MKRTRVAVLVLSLLGLVLTACTGSGRPATSAATEAGGTTTIRYLVGQPEDPSDLEFTKADIAEFEKANPDVKVQLDVIPNANVRTVIQTQLRSGEGPDVFGYDVGPGFAGVLANAGLLYDLTDAYQKFGWKTFDWAKARATYNGKVVGIPNELEMIGVFYNKDLFAKYGLSEPKNLADLEAAAEKFKANGITPFAFSDQEGWEGGHILSMILSGTVGPQGQQDLVDGKVPWTSQPVVDAIDLFFNQFNQRGFLPKSPAAITYDNSNALFYQGKAAMTPTGSWLYSDIDKNAKFDAGFIPFPTADGVGAFATGLGSGIFINANSTKSEAALKFLNWGQSAEHGRWQVEKLKRIPAFPVDTTGIEASPLFQQILDGTAQLSEGEGGFGLNIDVLTSDKFNDAMSSSLQGVLVGKMTAQQAAEAMQKGHEAGAKAK
jgi:raffinose/stachyose/melibiose transport system substrate-binding protein